MVGQQRSAGIPALMGAATGPACQYRELLADMSENGGARRPATLDVLPCQQMRILH